MPHLCGLMAPSSTVDLDHPRNLLAVTLTGHVTAGVMRTVFAEITAAAGQLKPDFTALMDLSSLERMDLDVAPILAAMMDTLLKKGVGKVVRVIPSPEQDIGFNILSIIHYRGKVRIATVESLAEAQQEL